MNTKSVCLLLGVLCLFGSSVFADIIIMADQSCRAEGSVRANDNRHDSSKLSVRASSNGIKSWIKFDISELEFGELESTTLTVSLHEGKSGNQSFDVSYVNDDVSDVVDVTGISNYTPGAGVTNEAWYDRNLTWNNAPGNDTASLGLLDATKTTYLGTVNFTDGFAGDSFTIDVLAALANDTDGIVQLVLHDSGNSINLSTHDHSIEAQRPFLDITERHIGANDPIPDGTVSVETSLAALSWLNPDPNDPVASITCDVYFGTDPNRPQMDMVTLAPDASSVDINATNFPTFVPLANRTWYYWFVDCHDPSAGPGGNAFMPGLEWSFFTDNNQPPVADAGPDQVVWLGMSGTPNQEVIQLDGFTSDDGLPDPQTDHTVLWTQVDNGAPAVTISPDNTDDTTVTVTARGVYEFTLTADDSAQQTPDTVEIIVGDDACDASHMSTGDPYNAADENEDCIVGVADFAAIIAANWLDCTDTLTNCGN